MPIITLSERNLNYLKEILYNEYGNMSLLNEVYFGRTKILQQCEKIISQMAQTLLEIDNMFKDIDMYNERIDNLTKNYKYYDKKEKKKIKSTLIY